MTSSLDADSLLKELTSRRSEVETLQEVVRLLAPGHPRDTALLIATASILRSRFGVKRLAYVHTFTPDRKPKLAYFHNFSSISRDAVEEALQATTITFPKPNTLLARMGVEVVMPLGRYTSTSTRVHRVEPRAWWFLGEFAESEEERSNDLIYMEIIGTLITVFLENNFIHEQQLAAERLRLERQALERELDFASRIQRRILSIKIPNLHPRLQNLTYYNALQRVGGDLSDFIQVDENNVYFYIGDVSGKGISAAIVMANLHGQIRTLAELNTDLPVIFSQLQRRISQMYGEEDSGFVTLFLGQIQFLPEGPILRYLNAGHPPSFLWRSDKLVPLKSTHTVLGIPLPGLPDPGAIAPQTIPLLPGDIFVGYTDGFIEQTNVNGQALTVEKLAELIPQAPKEKLEQLLQYLLKLLDNHRGEQPIEDDVSLLLWQLH